MMLYSVSPLTNETEVLRIDKTHIKYDALLSGSSN